MNDQLNPHALPFQPLAGTGDRRPWLPPHGFNPHMAPPPPPPPFMPPHHAFQGPPWNSFNARPPHFFHGNRNGFSQYAPHEQPRPQHLQHPQHFAPPWAQPGHPDFPPHNQPYALPPGVQQHFNQPPQQFQHPRHPPFHHNTLPAFPHPAHFASMQHPRMPQGLPNEELQAPAQPPKKSKKAKAKAKAQATANGDDAQDIPVPAKTPKKGRYGDEKIMLPAPQPTDLYLAQAAEEPVTDNPTSHVLVVLDLNGTVLYRPNKNAKAMIARPYLDLFLRYLFNNFKVMVWSSAKPANVKSLVEQALGKDLRSMLVATWARDTFGLSATNFNQNVQVYKNLRLIWSRDQIQQHHPKYADGERFGQHNTVLIDDSAIKASAQPHNLLEIPDFEATPEQMEGDVLREVAGYLELVRQQSDVSRFIKREPFKSDGTWKYDWPTEVSSGGEMRTKVSSKGKRKNLSPAVPMTHVTDAFSSVTLAVPSANEAVQVG